MLDANNLPDRQTLTAEVCIVGAGAAGIALAMEFIGTGMQVLVLEADGFDPASAVVATADSTADRQRQAQRPDGAKSASGGPMLRRGVRCRAFTDVELAARTWVPDSGWPIDADALTAHYQRALGLCESSASAFSGRRDQAALAQSLIPGLAREPFSADLLDQYAPTEPLAHRYRTRLAAAGNICVIGNAQVTALHLSADGRSVERLSIRTGSQRNLEVRARTVVLAAGSRGTARLLLASRDRRPDGVGNGHGNVGRYCMSPLRGTIGTVRLLQAPVAVWHGPRNRQRSRRALLLAADAQRQFRLPMFAMRLRPIPSDDLIGIALARLAGRSDFAYRFLINWHSEHYPASDCRVRLTDTSDSTGMPETALDWRTGAADTRGVRRALSLFDETLRKSGVGRFDHDPGALAALMYAGDRPDGVLVGGARMGVDPRNSVTDPDGRVHGIANLFVTGTAAFVTSGLDSPLLTAVALSLRLADHLKQQARAHVPLLSELRKPDAAAEQRATRAAERLNSDAE